MFSLFLKYCLLIVLISRKFDDMFLTKESGERKLYKGVGNLTAFLIYKPAERLFASAIG